MNKLVLVIFGVCVGMLPADWNHLDDIRETCAAVHCGLAYRWADSERWLPPPVCGRLPRCSAYFPTLPRGALSLLQAPLTADFLLNKPHGAFALSK